MIDEAAQRRFLTKFRVGDGCWEWTAAVTNKGSYGRFKLNSRTVVAHRVSYELFVGPIPAGLQLDHLCRNTRCVRPDHLEPVTSRENLMRGETLAARNAAKTHCPNGHPYDGTHHNGGRICRTCRRMADTEYARRYRARRSAA